MYRIALLFLLLLAGCQGGVVTSKFIVSKPVVKVNEGGYNIVRDRVIPDKYVIEYKCNECGRFHTVELNKSDYDKIVLGQNFYEVLK